MAVAGAAERGARLAASHPRRRQPAQLPGHLRGQRRRQRRQRAHRPFLRRAEPVRAHRVARRPPAQGLSPQRRRPHGLAGEPRGDDRAARHAELVSGAAAGRRRRHRRVVRGARRRQRPRRRPRGQRARDPRARRPPLRLSALGRPRLRPAAARRGARRAWRRARDLGVLRRRDRHPAAARQRDCRRCAGSTAIASSSRC